MKRTKEDLIEVHVKRADEAFNMAQIAVKNNYWNSAASHLYYTCFYLIQALFIKSGLEAHTHSGLQTLFNLHFIKSGKIDTRWSKLLNNVFELRQEGDYGDFIILDDEDILPLIIEVQEFKNIIRNLLAQ